MNEYLVIADYQCIKIIKLSEKQLKKLDNTDVESFVDSLQDSYDFNAAYAYYYITQYKPIVEHYEATDR